MYKISMKSVASLMAFIIIFVGLFSTPTCASAKEMDSSSEVIVEYFPNGDYITSTITTQDLDASTFATTSTRKGTKNYNYKSGGTVLWTVSVSATFTYNGSTSKCTKSTVSAVSKSSLWTIAKKSASKSGNSATATATAERYAAFVKVESITRSVTLKCSATGVLS